MKFINVLSLTLFIIFFAAYITKLIILRRKYNISANVLGKGKKGRAIVTTELLVQATTFFWGAVWLLESLVDNIIKIVFKDFFINAFINYIGITIIAVGVVTFIIAVISMKTSWRVGIDKRSKTILITQGIYKYTRNPAFVGFDLMFLGLFFAYPNLLTLAALAINVLSINNLILQEEKHLQSVFSDEYIEYKNKTPRYLFM
jgi:protein-S-isoprenylcysteine O-methyltransferase Ste14